MSEQQAQMTRTAAAALAVARQRAETLRAMREAVLAGDQARVFDLARGLVGVATNGGAGETHPGH